MLVISQNLTARISDIDHLLEQLIAISWNPRGEPAARLKRTAEACVKAGADALEINVQYRHDRPDVIEPLIRLVQEVTDRQLVLSADNPATIEAGLKACRRPPLANYVSFDNTRLREVLPLAARHEAGVIILASEPAAPTDAREMLARGAVLVGACHESGIPSDQIFIDPGLIHITRDVGQRHFVEVKEFLAAFAEAFAEGVRSTGWLGNVSAGAPAVLRPAIESAALATLAGLGLSSVFLNALSPELMRAVRLLKVLNNEAVYSDYDAEVQRPA